MFIGSGNIALQVREKIQQDNRFILLGGGYDEERVHFKEEELSQVDLCFTCGYHKLIPKKFVESYLSTFRQHWDCSAALLFRRENAG